MAISNEAQAVKEELAAAITLRRELETLEKEWSELLTVMEDSDLPMSEFAAVEAVHRQRTAVRRALSACQIRNWARISKAALTPFQQRILGLRYVRNLTWSDLLVTVRRSKQYVLREHNKALERLVHSELAAVENSSKKVAEVT